MRKEWQKPELEVLDINMTMAGAGHRNTDDFNDDPDKEDADKYS